MVVSICFITAIYGNYESSCKPYATQTIPTDFICFTDQDLTSHSSWIMDRTPYHDTHPSPLDKMDTTQTNSLHNNRHTFNIAKYYKQAFTNIPRLKQYEVIVWVDGTIEITNPRTSEWIMNNIGINDGRKMIGWHHEHREGCLYREVEASRFYRYTSTYWNNQSQPYQDVDYQYECYQKDGYDESVCKQLSSHTPHFGVWITCFVAFLHNDPEVRSFLDLWYLQTLTYTTQDQIGFPYTCQKTGLYPYTLPNDEIDGERPHERTAFYIKHPHGQ